MLEMSDYFASISQAWTTLCVAVYKYIYVYLLLEICQRVEYTVNDQRSVARVNRGRVVEHERTDNTSRDETLHRAR